MARALCVGTEVVILALVVLSPWAFGGAEPIFEHLLNLGLALVLILWSARLLCEGACVWKRCPVVWCLALVFLSGVWQITPLPRSALRAVSPATADLYEQLLPAEREVLIADPVADDTPVPAAGDTISVYPGVTRRQLVRVLAVLLLFAAARNHFAPGRGLKLLSLAVFFNGILLAVHGLVQFFATHGNAFWPVPGISTVFGPFLYRNFYSMYLNICVGAGLGLLLAWAGNTPDKTGRRKHRRDGARRSTWETSVALDWRDQVALALRRPRLLGTALALALMLSTLLVAQCRAGVLVVLAAAALFLALGRRRLPAGTLPLLLGVTAVVAVALLAWFGFDLTHSRFRSVWTGEILGDVRGKVWLRFLPLAKSFPVWGTGLGTFAYAEMPLEAEENTHFQVWDHAHNEYIEALIEGGAVRLGLTLLALGLIFRRAYVGAVRGQSRSAAALIVGGAFGLTTLVLHSLFEFGMAFPSIVILATVLAACLCNEADAPERREYRLRLGGLAPVAGAAIFLSCAFVLGFEGWRSYRVQRFTITAMGLNAAHGPVEFRERIALLEAAMRLEPNSVRLRLMAGDAYTEQFERRCERWFGKPGALAGVDAALQLPTLNGPLGAALTAASGAVDVVRRAEYERVAQADPALAAALHHYLYARDLCPLAARPHVRLAANRQCFARADAPATYLERAKTLAPYDAELWYVCGILESRDGRLESAVASWRRSIALSDRNFVAILHQCQGRLSGAEILARVVPSRPDLLVVAARVLYPAAEAAERRPFLERALSLIEQRPAPLDARALYQKAEVLELLGQPAAARAAFQTLLEKEPASVGYRFAYAKLLFNQGDLAECEHELARVLQRQPSYGPARELRRAVTRARSSR